MKRLLVLLVLLAAIGGGYVYWEKTTSKAPVAASHAPVSVSTVPVKIAPMVDSIAAYGNLVSRRAVNLSPETPGVVREILFADGQKVSPGAPLVRMDSSIAEAQLQSARAQADTDMQNLRRIQTLARQGLDSTSSLEQAQSRASASQADVKINERKLWQLTLRAPFAGTLGSRKVDVGAFVNGGETIVRLEDTSELQIEFRMPSEVAPKVHERMPVHITLPGSDEALTGALTFIDPTVSTDTRSVLLRAVVENQTTAVRPGLFVKVALDLAVHPEALVVPVDAITSELASAYVFVVDDKSVARKRTVTLGLSDGSQVEVLDGLRAGDAVVTIGQFRLRDGDTVKVVPADEGKAAKGAT